MLTQDTPFLAPLCIWQSRLSNIWVPPESPVFLFNIQYWYWYCQYRVKAKLQARIARPEAVGGNSRAGRGGLDEAWSSPGYP